MDRLLNVALRGGSLLGKFVLIFFLARMLEPEAVGLYGLAVVTITYCLYVVGLDFYTHSTRDLLAHDKEVWGQLLKSQSVFFMVMYAVVLPSSLLLFVFDFLPWKIVGWFLALLVLEHINQELGRLLIVMSEQITASLVLFLRSGVWCIAVILWMGWKPESRTLDTVFLFWFIGCLLGAALGIWRCSRIQMGGWREKVDWRWIRKGLTVAIPLLVGTLALRGVYTIDRYWFEALVSLEVLGAYVLFMGMCNALMSFLDAGVFMYSYPALIRHHNVEDNVAFQQELKRLGILTITLCLLFSVASAIALPWLLQWLDRPLYSEHQQLFWWLLTSLVLFAVGMVPHYALYAKGLDKPIIKSHVLGFVIFVPTVYVLAQFNSYLAVPLALILVFALILVLKLGFFINFKKLAV